MTHAQLYIIIVSTYIDSFADCLVLFRNVQFRKVLEADEGEMFDTE